MISAGALNVTATLQQRSKTDDGQGGELVRYKTLASMPVKATSNGGRAFFEAKKQNAQLTHEVTMRYREDLKPDMRLVYGSTVLNIETYMDPDGDQTSLLVFCREVLA